MDVLTGAGRRVRWSEPLRNRRVVVFADLRASRSQCVWFLHKRMLVMTGQSENSEAAPSDRCPQCGAPAQGNFCSECGAALTGKPANAYILFVDSFFKLGELRRYVALYVRLLRAPVRATLELFEQSTLQDALRFLEYSVGILILLFISRLVAVPGSDLLSGLIANAYFVLAQSVGLLLHYRIAVGRSQPPRSFDEFMRLAAIFYGFTLPISAVLQAVSLVNRTAGSILFIVATPLLLVYAVMTWRRFWGLPAWAVFLVLFFSSLVGMLAGLAFVTLAGRLL